MTKRQAALEELFARAALIRKASGYASDCGQAIYFGINAQLGPDDPAEAIGISVGDDRVRDESGSGVDDGLTYIELPVQFAALASVEQLKSEAWRRVEAVLGDIKRAVEFGDRSLSGLLVKPLQRGPTRTMRAEAGSGTLGVSVQYVLAYVETFGDPEA